MNEKDTFYSSYANYNQSLICVVCMISGFNVTWKREKKAAVSDIVVPTWHWIRLPTTVNSQTYFPNSSTPHAALLDASVLPRLHAQGWRKEWNTEKYYAFNLSFVERFSLQTRSFKESSSNRACLSAIRNQVGCMWKKTPIGLELTLTWNWYTPMKGNAGVLSFVSLL